MQIDHLGIAVESLEGARAVWEGGLGAALGPVEEVPQQGVRVAFLSVGAAHLELLEPTGPETPVGRFLARGGRGVHHVAFAVPSVDAKLQALADLGLRLIDRVGRTGARGRRVGFAHPSAFGGVLVEFVEAP